MQRSSSEQLDILTRCSGMLAAVRSVLKNEMEFPDRAQALRIVRRHEAALVELALEARKLANSYRNFDVGAVFVGLRQIRPASVVMGVDVDEKLSWYLRFAANTKEERGEKYCAEQRLMDAALRKGVRHVVAFVIAGEPQADHGSGKKGITLTPCEACRWRMRGLMRESRPLVGLDTLVISVNCHMSWARKYQTVADLHQFHCEPLESE